MPEAPDTGESRRSVRLTPRTALLVIGTLLGTLLIRNIFVSAHRVLGWAVAAAVGAVLLKPAVDALSRVMPRVLAILVLAVGIGALTTGVVYGVFEDLRTETAALRQEGPRAAERLAERDDRVGRIARDLRLPERAEDGFAAVEDRFGVDDETIASAVGTVPAYFVGFILMMFFVLYGPAIVDGSLDQLPRHRRHRWQRSVHEGVTAARQYLWVSIAQGLAMGLSVFGIARAWDLPAPAVLGLVAGGAAMVPYIGVLIGAMPLILLAAGLRSVGSGVWVFVAFGALQIVESLVVRRAIDRRTLHVGPAIPVVVGVLGLDLYGIGGAVFAIAVAVLLLGVADAFSDDDEALPTPSDDWTDDEPDPEPAATS